MSNSAEFTSLIKQHEGILFKLSNAYADRREERQDLYQEMVYQLWKSFDSYKGNSSWSTWMYRVALNTAIRHLKLTSASQTSSSSYPSCIASWKSKTL